MRVQAAKFFRICHTSDWLLPHFCLPIIFRCLRRTCYAIVMGRLYRAIRTFCTRGCCFWRDAGSAARFDADLNLLCRVEMPTLAQQVVDPAFYHDDLIQMTQLGDDVCLIGAAAYARSQFFAPIGVK
jgi:hypothetical protein